jgi:hypothetical protein
MAADNVDEQGIVIAELFTSQSCSSCPPADLVMAELSRRPDVLALSYHVDYWDHLGWKDTYSSPDNTRRQQQYAAANGFQVYTPQLVVEGNQDAVGSDRRVVLRTISQAHSQLLHAPVEMFRNPGQSIDVIIGRSRSTQSGISGIMLVSFDAQADTAVKSGENAGRRLAYHNVVRSMSKIGTWNNQAIHLTQHLHDDEAGRDLAIIVQADDGTVWGVSAPNRQSGR